MEYALVQATLYMIFAAIEQDFRRLVVRELQDQVDPEKIFTFNQALSDRLLRDLRSGPGAMDGSFSLEEHLNKCNFADYLEILNAHKFALKPEVRDQLPFLRDVVKRLTPIRNRVAHARPLQYEDTPTTFNAVSELVNKSRSLWPKLLESMELQKREPWHVLSLDRTGLAKPSEISHNLPRPDFDETGFIGREADVKRLRHRLSNDLFPLVTIVAEGGIGKTALALKTAYELLEESEPLFEAIVWTSAKANILTPTQIKDVEGAIKDSLGLLDSAGKEIGIQRSDDLFKGLLEYLKEFRILLVLDNIETVLDSFLMEFVESLDGQLKGSKVLLTSRVRVGTAAEDHVPLKPLVAAEAVKLLRRLGNTRGLPELSKVEDEVASTYCRQMNNNPGHLKWFVSAVQSGARPEAVLSDPSLFLDFCLSNVYEYLSQDSITVIQVLQLISGPLSLPHLTLLTGLAVSSLEKALVQLLGTNMVTMPTIRSTEESSWRSGYALSEMARQYLAKRHRVPRETMARLLSQHEALIREAEEITAYNARHNKYSYDIIKIRSQSDAIVAKYLRDAMNDSKAGIHDAAARKLAEAKHLAPQNPEVHRIEASLKIREEDYAAAKSCYEAALHLDPDSPILLTGYGGFLLRQMKDAAGAERELQRAVELDSDALEPSRDLALTLLALRKFGEAEQVIQSLLRRDNLGTTWRRIVADLNIQLNQRRATTYAFSGNLNMALNSLDALRAAFQNIPNDIVDGRMLMKLKRGKSLSRRLKREATDEYCNSRATELANWFKLAIGGPDSDNANSLAEIEGQISMWSGDKAYGFIADEYGERHFFHYRHVVSETPIHTIAVGQPVFFEIGAGRDGRSMATHVDIVVE